MGARQNRKNNTSMTAPQYVPERDGSMRKYLETCRDQGRIGLFLGTDHYRDLWDADLLMSEVTSIRIMYGQRPDEHYRVISRDLVEGLLSTCHSGKPGEHSIDEVIPGVGVMFEVFMWKRGASF
jgi:hypothetical protein